MDIRKIKTRTKIQDALLTLLSQLSFDKITISLLCEEAGINRGTFYLHYNDIFDVFVEIENAFYKDIMRCLESGEKDLLLLIFKGVKNHGKLVSLILLKNLDNDFVDKVINLAHDYCIYEWKKVRPDASDEELEYSHSFFSKGMLGLVCYWCKTNFKASPEDITKMVKNFASYFSISFDF